MQLLITLIQEVLLLNVYYTTTSKTVEMIKSDHRFDLQSKNIKKNFFFEIAKILMSLCDP